MARPSGRRPEIHTEFGHRLSARLARAALRPGGPSLESRDVGNAVLVHPRGFVDGRALTFTQRLAADPQHTLVVLDLPASPEDAVWETVARALDRRGTSFRIVPGRGSREDVKNAAQRLADRLDCVVVAPDGAVLPAAGGALFVPAHHGMGWLRYRPNLPSVPDSRRFPKPQWEFSVPDEPRPTGAGGMIEPLPGGVWIRGTWEDAAAAVHRKRLAELLAAHPDLLGVAVGSPGAAALPLEEIAAFWETLPSSARPLVRFVPYGPVAVPDGAPLGQALADLLGEPVAVYAGIPVPSQDGTATEVHTLQRDGTLGWRPYATEFGFEPRARTGGVAAAPVALGTRPPVGSIPAVAPGVYQYAPDVMLEVVQSGLWVRPPAEPHDGHAVRTAPTDPASPAVLYDGTNPMAADRMRFIAYELLRGLDPSFGRHSRVMPSSEAGRGPGGGHPALPAAPAQAGGRLQQPAAEREAATPSAPDSGTWTDTPAVRASAPSVPGETADPSPSAGTGTWTDAPAPRPSAPLVPGEGPSPSPDPGTWTDGPAGSARDAAPGPQAVPPARPPVAVPESAGPAQLPPRTTEFTGPSVPPPVVPTAAPGPGPAAPGTATTARAGAPQPPVPSPPAATPVPPAPAPPVPAPAPTGPPPAAPVAPEPPTPATPLPASAPDEPPPVAPPPAAASPSPSPSNSPTPGPSSSAPRIRLESSPTQPPTPRPAAPGPATPPPPAAAPPAAPAPRPPVAAPRPGGGGGGTVRVQPEPSAAATVVPPEKGVERERDWLRRSLGGRYDTAAAFVSRVLSETPGLHGGPRASAGDALTDLAAVRLYLTGATAAIDAAIRAGSTGPHVPLARCAACGVRRLPSYRGAALLRAPLNPAERAWYREGAVVTEHSFLAALTTVRRDLAGTTDVLLWSLTARRTALVVPEVPDRVLFAPGTRFKVLRAVDGERPVVMLRELGAAEVGADGGVAGGRVPLDEIALAGLEQVHDFWQKAEQNPDELMGDPLPDDAADAFAAAPGLSQHPPAGPRHPATPAGTTPQQPQKGAKP